MSLTTDGLAVGSALAVVIGSAIQARQAYTDLNEAIRLCGMKSAPGRRGKILNAEVSGMISISGSRCPQKDSNLRTWLRRPVLYPLSYGGQATEQGYQSVAAVVTRAGHDHRPLRQDPAKPGSLTECDARIGAGACR